MTDKPGFTSGGTAVPEIEHGGGVFSNQIVFDELQRSLARAPTQIAVAEGSIKEIRRRQDRLEKSFEVLEEKVRKAGESRVVLVLAALAIVIPAVGVIWAIVSQ